MTKIGEHCVDSLLHAGVGVFGAGWANAPGCGHVSRSARRLYLALALVFGAVDSMAGAEKLGAVMAALFVVMAILAAPEYQR